MRKPKPQSKGTTPLPAADGVRDKAALLKLSRDLAAYARQGGDADALASSCADLARREFGCYVSAYLPSDIISNFEEQYPEMTREQAKEVLEGLEFYNHINRAEWDAIEDLVRLVMAANVERKQNPWLGKDSK